MDICITESLPCTMKTQHCNNYTPTKIFFKKTATNVVLEEGNL